MVGVDQAGQAVHMDAPVSLSIKPLRAEIAAFLGAEQMRLRHLHARIFGHEAIGIFNRPRITRILRGWKLDHPVLKAVLQFLAPVNNSLFVFAHLRDNLWTRAGGGTVKAQQFLENFLILSGKNNRRLFRQFVQSQIRPVCVNGAAIRLIAERAHAVLPDIGQPIQRRKLTAIDAVFFNGAIKKQTAPAIRQAVVENAIKPIEDHVRANEHARLQRQSYR